MNYNELDNKPQINGIVLIGNKTAADLNLASTSDLAGKQDSLTETQLTAVNSGITSSLVTQIGTNTTAISGKQDQLTPTQLTAVNSGITSSLVTQIENNQNNILIVDITSFLTPSTGFAVNSNSKLYKQNNHIFGTIIIEKTGGYFSTAQETIANISAYAPTSNYFACPCFCTSLWNVQNIGYGFIARSGISESGNITVSDIVTTNNYVKLAVDYITP